jgi:hypothetical protein
MTTVTWTPDRDGLLVDGQSVPWAEVTLSQIRAAAPFYASHAGVSEHRARVILLCEWERKQGHAYD